MTTRSVVIRKADNRVRNSILIVIALATAFFPRMLELVGAPAAINFLHFATVPLCCGIVLTTARSQNRKQLAITSTLLTWLFILFTIEFASALLNEAGVINAVLNFLLLAEPFMLLLAIVSIPLSLEKFDQFRAWVLGFGLFNVFFAVFQKFVLRWDTCGCSPGNWTDGDAIKGVFINQGSGHVVNASVSSTIGIYYFLTAKHRPMWLRVLVLMAGLGSIFFSQANQAMLVLMAAMSIFSLVNLKDAVKAILYIIGTILFIFIFFWAIERVPALSTFKTWIRPEIYGPDGEATLLKFSGIRIILSSYTSPLHWLLGLGPGHTIGRLGGWMLKDYGDLLNPLGATRSPVSRAVWSAVAASWLGTQSSFFSPFFGWAAIWGDLGIVGLGVYLYLCAIVWQKLCADDISKFILLTIAIHGLIFTQMEEPGYMLFMASLIGLRWQEHETRKYSRLDG